MVSDRPMPTIVTEAMAEASEKSVSRGVSGALRLAALVTSVICRRFCRARATIARLAPQQRRATALGIMNAIYGVAWFAGSVLLGVLYDISIVSVVLASALLQAAALPILAWLASRESAVPRA